MQQPEVQPSTLPRSFTIGLAVATALIPLATAYVGGKFADASARAESETRLVELAVTILQDEPRPGRLGLRQWAVDVIDQASQIPIPQEVRAQLQDTLSLPGMRWIDVKVNGEDGSVTLQDGQAFGVTWTSQGVTVCDQEKPVSTGIPVEGHMVITPGMPDYPSPESAVTFSISCMAGGSYVRDYVVVSRRKSP